MLHGALQAHSALEWEAIFGEEVPCAAARAVEEMFGDAQVLEQGMVADYEHPVVGRYRGFRGPVAFGRTPGPEPFAAPVLGQHTDEVRAEAAAITPPAP